MSWNKNNPAVKRIMQEIKELKSDTTAGFIAEALETDIFEWHFVMRGPPDSEFQGGIYHGRILLPADYPFKPPAFMMLTPNGRFETGMKICLSISSHHPEHWQPSWSVRTALTAMIAFMPSPGQGALGSLDFSKDERRKLASRSRTQVPQYGSAERQQIIDEMHARMVALDAEQASASGSDSASATTAQSVTSVTVDPTSTASPVASSGQVSETPAVSLPSPQPPSPVAQSSSSASQAQQPATTSPPASPAAAPAVAGAAAAFGTTSSITRSPAAPAPAPTLRHQEPSSASLVTASTPPNLPAAAQPQLVGRLPQQVVEVQSSIGDRSLNMLALALILGIAAILCRKVLAVVGHPWAAGLSI